MIFTLFSLATFALEEDYISSSPLSPFLTFAAALITSLIGAWVTWITFLREKKDSTETATEKGLREGNEVLLQRILLRDEEIEKLKEDIQDQKSKTDKAEIEREHFKELYTVLLGTIRAEAKESERK